jgi:hypothetical protein
MRRMSRLKRNPLVASGYPGLNSPIVLDIEDFCEAEWDIHG